MSIASPATPVGPTFRSGASSSGALSSGASGSAATVPRTIDVALFGLGRVGAAVANLAHAREAGTIRLIGALVREPERPRAGTVAHPLDLTSDPDVLFARRPDVIVEVLGNLEPARTLVCDALHRGISVVTANKSLLAAHGEELLGMSARTGARLLYEASVLAGVPFLGTFARRPTAASVSRIVGIVNGTSNFIVSMMQADGLTCAQALARAQQLGLAEPDPRYDLRGLDAAEKLAVLLQHFSLGAVHPSAIETTGIEGLRAVDFEIAADFGGVLKPIVSAHRTDAAIEAFVGPAFVPFTHRLSRIDGVENALALTNPYGDLFYSGPGAGPAPTAATILDDVIEAGFGGRSSHQPPRAAARPTQVQAPATGWFVRITGNTLPTSLAVADRLGSYGVDLQRSSARLGSEPAYGLLTRPCTRTHIEHALGALSNVSRRETFAIRTLD